MSESDSFESRFYEIANTNMDLDTSVISLNAFCDLRPKFADEVSDILIIKFLIARKGNTEEAYNMLTEAIKWKANTYPILKNTCLKELTSGKFYVHGTDKYGHPLMIYSTRLHSVKDRDLDEMLLSVIYTVNIALNKMTKQISKFTVIVDRSNYGSDSQDIEALKKLAGVMQNNFPECLSRVLIYPSGIVFYGIWNITKWFLDPVTRGKVEPCLQLSGIQAHVDDEFIPVSMGGKSTYVHSIDMIPDPFEEMNMKAMTEKYEDITISSSGEQSSTEMLHEISSVSAPITTPIPIIEEVILEVG